MKESEAKKVTKKWGYELWFELNDKYCYKKIFIKAGTRTSFQYHEKKMETMYILSGKGKFLIENELGEVKEEIMETGEFITILPPKKHRVIALTDLILLECSTPEVDDIIRIDDDYGRKDGKIEEEHK